MTKSGKSKCHAAARVGINPTPTVAECCNHFDNPLIAKVLHTSVVGMGFIPVLPIADKIKSKYPAAATVGRKVRMAIVSRKSLTMVWRP